MAHARSETLTAWGFLAPTLLLLALLAVYPVGYATWCTIRCASS